MIVRIHPSKLSGKIKAPPSKSYLHRAIIAASLSTAESIISNVRLNDDVIMTMKAMIKLGAEIRHIDDTLIIRGFKPALYKHDYLEIDCMQSGSTLRFLIPLCSFLSRKTVFKGKESLFTRPLDEYTKMFNDCNAKFTLNCDSLFIEGALLNNSFSLSIDKSSQFLTGILFLAPLLDDLTVINIKDLSDKSVSFIKMTLEIIEYFGIDYQLDKNIIRIKGNQKFKARNYECEGDYSLSAFYLLSGLLNGSMSVTGLNISSLQGDKAILNIIKKCNGKIMINDNLITSYKSRISKIDYSIADCIDLGPILTVFALFLDDISLLRNAENLVLKESDRVNSVITELKKVNADVLYNQGSLIIRPQKLSYTDLYFETYEDHRVAFALTLLAMNLDKPSVINGFECVSKSYPEFLKDIESLGVRYEIIG